MPARPRRQVLGKPASPHPVRANRQQQATTGHSGSLSFGTLDQDPPAARVVNQPRRKSVTDDRRTMGAGRRELEHCRITTTDAVGPDRFSPRFRESGACGARSAFEGRHAALGRLWPGADPRAEAAPTPAPEREPPERGWQDSLGRGSEQVVAELQLSEERRHGVGGHLEHMIDQGIVRSRDRRVVHGRWVDGRRRHV